MKPVVDVSAQLASIEADEQTQQLDLPRITAQQRVYVAARVSGLSITASGKEAGAGTTRARRWEHDPIIQAYIDKYSLEMAEHSLPRVQFGIEDAHAMYMKAYHVSDTAAEMVRATDSLVKLHRVGEEKPSEVPNEVTVRQLADLPLAELVRLAGLSVESVQPNAIEGEYAEIDE